MPEENQYQPLTIRKIITETPDARTFILEDEGENIYSYKSGQFLTFNFQGISSDHRRSYSISSSPHLNEPLAITVKRVENGEFSRYFIDHAKVGDVLQCVGVGGLFVLPEDIDDYNQIFFLAAGSGITPSFSLIKTILAEHPNISIVLIYSNRSAVDTIFYQQLKTIATESHGRLKIDFLFSTSNNILKSRLNNSLLSSLLDDYRETSKEKTLAYICGPVEYMDTVGITLLTDGIPKANIHKEIFTSYIPEIVDLPPDTLPHKVRIKLKDRVAEMTVQHPVSILHQAMKEGIALPYSCESGQCGSCAARCTSGHVWIAYNEILTERELNQGLVLTCQGFPFGGDVELEY
jgi:ring-1,2-phenylacetyl-CoA epoxidase subunit PaaE